MEQEKYTLPIYNSAGEKVDTVKLDAAVFGGAVNTALIQQAVVAYRANQRKGLAGTKTRGEVSGGGRKPWKQKGTGRARVGSIRSPLWRHGGVIFGPHPRDYSIKLPQKMRVLALKSALSIKLNEDNFIVLDNFKLNNVKTKEAAKIFSNLKIKPEKKVLLLLDRIDGGVQLAARNINTLNVGLVKDTNTYEVMCCHKLVITHEGLIELTKRLK